MPAPQPMGVKQCERCQRDFRRRYGQSVVSFNKLRFCSPSCRNKARAKKEPRITLAQLAVLSIACQLEEAGQPLVVRRVSERYHALKGDAQPLRPDGQPNVGTVRNILLTLSGYGLFEHHRGQGAREGAFRTTPRGRAVLEERRKVSAIPVALEFTRVGRVRP